LIRLALFASCVVAAALLAAILIVVTAPEPDRSAGSIQGGPRSAGSIEAVRSTRHAAQIAVDRQLGREPENTARQILFGDLHVHSTFSIDAFVYALPMFAGEGAHPPADACDFARYCAGLDFFSINDHAEGLTQHNWQETKQSIRDCNERAGDPQNPDLVAFTGFEWTQTGPTPETHYGHRNVIFPGLSDAELPTRPITALPPGITQRARAMGVVRVLEKTGPLGLGEYADFLALTRQIAELPDCPTDASGPSLTANCRENASTPAELYARLSAWGFENLVIPHGLAWGIHAPPGASLDSLLEAGNHDPKTERLLEIMSGHGNSEEFRAGVGLATDSAGQAVCQAPTADFYPCCWRAGEIVRERCGDTPEPECNERVRDARRFALAAGTSPHLVLPDTTPEDWLDCDQCRDCFKPASNYRPQQTAQYGLTRSDKLRFGFVASTDNHASRPGTGYKQYQRRRMSDSRGLASPTIESWLRPFLVGQQQHPDRAQAADREPRSFAGLLDVERGGSFMYPGGIVGVHATGRDRRSIWDALMRREVYGTSGPRMLLWFDLVNAPGGRAPMGSEVEMDEIPRFEVRAVGALNQQPGCDDESLAALSPDRHERLCRGECYNPGDQRELIEAIEIVRVRQQPAIWRHTDPETLATLIDDPWRRIECPPHPSGCVFSFEDPDFPVSSSSGNTGATSSVSYYARAFQTATPAINGNTLRTVFDEAGNPIQTTPCHGGFRTSPEDDCLAPVRERAWSSPIYLDPVVR
jgi:hypothetical protein